MSQLSTVTANTCHYTATLTDLAGSFSDRCYHQPRISSDFTIKLSPLILRRDVAVKVFELQFSQFDVLASDQIIVTDASSQKSPILVDGSPFNTHAYISGKQLIRETFFLLASKLEIRFTSTAINSNRALGFSYIVRTDCPAGMELRNVSLSRKLDLQPSIFAEHFLANSEYQDATCLLCPPGYYRNSSSSNNNTCVICAAGQFVATSGKLEPTLCPSGSFSSQSGSAACTLCGPGTFQPANGSTTCHKCPLGTASSQLGAVVCESCLLPRVDGIQPTVVGMFFFSRFEC